MKKVLGYGLVFISVFVTSLIVYLPASFVVKQLPLPRQLQLIGVDGTIWQGQAEQVIWQNRNFGDVQWTLNVSALLSQKLEAMVRFGRGSSLNLYGKGLIGYRSEGAYAKNLVMSIPADTALTQAPLPLPVVAQGQLELTIKDYVYQAPLCLSAQGTLAWTAAKVESPFGNLALEQAIADIQCAQSTVQVTGNQNSAEVSSEFSAQLSPNYRYQANGWFKPGTDFPKSLADKLKWLPRPDSQGRYQFKQQGRL